MIIKEPRLILLFIIGYGSILGLSWSFSYWYSFGINPIAYADSKEIILLSFPWIFILLVIYIIVYFIITYLGERLYEKHIEPLKKDINNIEEDLSNNEIHKKMQGISKRASKIKIILDTIVYLYVIYFILIIALAIHFNNYYFNSIAVYSILGLLLLLPLPKSIARYYNYNDKIRYIILIIIILPIFISVNAMLNAKATKEGINTRFYKEITSEVQQEENIAYVGKLGNNLFLYDLCSNQTKIINLSTVDRFIIYKKDNYVCHD